MTKKILQEQILPDKFINPPSKAELKKWLNLWENDKDENGKKLFENYHKQCECLKELFTVEFPTNAPSEFNKILAKVAVLNDFYSTNIYKPAEVAQRIVNHKDFDLGLQKGDAELVNAVRGELENETTADGKPIDSYSFATKYCSFHQPEKYQIYDTFCGRVLFYWLNANEKFYEKLLEKLGDYKLEKHKSGKKKDVIVATHFDEICRNYESYLKIIEAFRDVYGLEDVSCEKLDRYIWLSGKYYFPTEREISAENAAKKIEGLKEYGNNLKIKNMPKSPDKSKKIIEDIKNAIGKFLEKPLGIQRVLRISGLGDSLGEFEELSKSYRPEDKKDFVLVFEE